MYKEIKAMVGELKSCPFCGGNVELTLVGNDFMGCKQSEVKCTKCYVRRTQTYIYMAHNYEFIASSIRKHWNRRYKGVNNGDQ